MRHEATPFRLNLLLPSSRQGAMNVAGFSEALVRVYQNQKTRF